MTKYYGEFIFGLVEFDTEDDEAMKEVAHDN